MRPIDEEAIEPRPATGLPTQRWLHWKLQHGEITVQEFLKLSKQRGDMLRDYPLDTRKPDERP